MSCSDCGLGIPHTVRASHIPLYLRGGMGDVPDFTDLGPTVDSPILGPVDYSATFPASPDQTPSYSDMLSNPNLIPTTPTTGVGPAMGPVPVASTSGLVSSVSQAISNFFKPSGSSGSTLAPGPSPRVSYSPATVSMSSALPYLGLGLVAFVLLTGMGGRRR